MNSWSSERLLKKLVSHPTVSRNSNLELIAFIQTYLADQGIHSELLYNEERTKANLFATVGPRDRSGVVLSGHTDVVPTEGQTWTSDPFLLTERDGRLFGRGTADMKGFIACVLAAVAPLARQRLEIPIHLAFSYDEEVGCLGVRPMLAELAKRRPKPHLCIVGEPTGMRPVLGHKGKLAMRCHVRGAACHSAFAPSGVNAIEYGAKLIARLEQIGSELANPLRRDERFDPPFSTVQTGVIRGGRALNIVPDECEFDFEVRALPGFDPQQVVHELSTFATNELVPKMKMVSPSAGIRMEALGGYPGLATAQDSEAALFLSRLCQTLKFGTVAFGTEGGLFHQVGIPTVVCGPGSMDQGHKADEFITREQLASCDLMLDRLAVRLGSGADAAA